MTFAEWWAIIDPVKLSMKELAFHAWTASDHEVRRKRWEACHVESRPDGYWLVLKNKSGEAVINLDGPSRGPIVRTVLTVASLEVGKEA